MLPRVPPQVLVDGHDPEPSPPVALRIAEARRRQLARTGDLNGRLSGRRLMAEAHLSERARTRLADLADMEGLSARGTERLLRVALTIADLGEEPAVVEAHLDEAARFRTPARRLSELAAG